SVVVSRVSGTVLVTVNGDLGPVGADLLEDVLIDLIDGQGNGTVSVDLSGAVVEPRIRKVFVAAAARARGRRTRFVLRESASEPWAALSPELTNGVTIRAERASDAPASDLSRGPSAHPAGSARTRP
ncbi:MAG: hypothetical protein M3066_11785, partial [Actinomycetota bacterium]|nr:hypothetical protein [Actinomycetota bacterium]